MSRLYENPIGDSLVAACTKKLDAERHQTAYNSVFCIRNALKGYGACVIVYWCESRFVKFQ